MSDNEEKVPEKKDIKAILDVVVRRTMNIDFTWNWPGGVAFYGLGRAFEVTGEQEYLDFLANWVDNYRRIGLPTWTVNAISLGHALITLHDATGKDEYLDLLMQKVDYLEHEALRFGDGVFQHTVSPDNDFPEQAWADTLFMAAYFMLRMGKKLGHQDLIDDALKQWYWHEEYLQDPVTNLYFHGWDNVRQTHMSGIFWARGNAWAAYTMARALGYIDYTYPAYMRIEGSLRDQLASLVRLQTPNGLWHTILTDQDSYEETSGSAGIAAALAVVKHPLYSGYLAKAYTGITKKISAEGSVVDVSAGTGVMPDAAAYKDVPKKRVQGWGQGLVLAFLSALIDPSLTKGSSL